MCPKAATGDELLTIGALHSFHRACFAHVVLIAKQLTFPLAAIVTTTDLCFPDSSVSLSALFIGPWFSAAVWALGDVEASLNAVEAEELVTADSSMGSPHHLMEIRVTY